MNFINYLKDNKNWISYFIVIDLCWSVFLLFENIDLNKESVIYLNVISIITLMVFVIVEYIKKNSRLNLICNLIKNKVCDYNEIYQKNYNYEQSLFIEMINKLDVRYKELKNHFISEKKEMNDFVVYWFHEIKNPITAMKVLFNLDSKTKDELIDLMEDKIGEIENYVDQSLYYARSDSFANDYIIEEFDVEKVIKNNIKKISKQFISKRLKLSLKNLNHSVKSDKKWLSFIFEQVILNAVKYSKKNGEIDIYCIKSDNELDIVIKDNGIGIKEEDIKRVFDKAFTGNIGRQNNSSTGMGLYLSKKLAHKLGHEIYIESKHNEYTKLIISFLNHTSII